MKKLLFTGLIVCAFVVACGKAQTTSTTGDVAKVNGITISATELNDAAKGRLQKVEQEIFQAKKDTLEALIDKKLIEEAAKKQDKSVENYLKANIEEKATPPTDDEIKNFYNANKERMQNKPLKDVSNDIKAFLTQSKKQAARQQLMSGLRAAADIKIELEPPRMNVEAGDNPSMGPKSAPITIVEFTDYQCPFCSRIRTTINQLFDDYKDKIRYVLRDFPLSFHQYAIKAHEAAHCAGEQNKYWDYNKLLWANQQALQIDKLKEYAKQIKLNTSKFDKCLDSGKYTKKVQENAEYGASVGATGTPSFFINGIAISGAQPLSNFKNIIDQELKK